MGHTKYTEEQMIANGYVPPPPVSEKAKRKQANKLQGQGVTANHNSASRCVPIIFTKLDKGVQESLKRYLSGNGRPEEHFTDPITGNRKGHGVTVKEYYPLGPENPARLVSRSTGKRRTWYYSPHHNQRQYTYHEITEIPTYAGAPLPRPYPSPSPPTIEDSNIPVFEPPATFGSPPSARVVPDCWEDEP
jgi:hypothetical protein